MTGETYVNHSGMQEGSGAIRGIFIGLTNTLENLERDLSPMVQHWEGGAQVAFNQAKANWDAGAKALALLLERIGNAVGTADENYRLVDDWAARQFQA